MEKIHTIDLATPVPLGTGSEHLHGLRKAVSEIEKQTSRIYQTHVPTMREDTYRYYVFVTTSKDAHLIFGNMNLECQYHLAKLLEEEFSKSSLITHILLSLDAKNTMLVTRDTYVFTFSPAH